MKGQIFQLQDQFYGGSSRKLLFLTKNHTLWELFHHGLLDKLWKKLVCFTKGMFFFQKWYLYSGVRACESMVNNSNGGHRQRWNDELRKQCDEVLMLHCFNFSSWLMFYRFITQICLSCLNALKKKTAKQVSRWNNDLVEAIITLSEPMKSWTLHSFSFPWVLNVSSLIRFYFLSFKLHRHYML